MNARSTLITPSSEENSLILHSHHSCSYAKCSYCPNFGPGKRERFHIDEFRDFLNQEARRYVTEDIHAVFLAENNLLGMPHKQVVNILKALREVFPNLNMISAYGGPIAISGISDDNLAVLRKAGLTRVHMGIESGSNTVLALLNKGIKREELTHLAQRVMNTGLELYIYILIGAGGSSLTGEHVAQTTDVINSISPHLVEFHTLVLVPGTPLAQLNKEGGFNTLSPYEAIDETVKMIKGINTQVDVRAQHVSNYVQLQGRLPDDRPRLLEELSYAKSLDEDQFENAGLVNITLPA